MQLFPYGQTVPIVVTVDNLPQAASGYPIITIELISEDLKVRGQRYVKTYEKNMLTITNETESDSNWSAKLECKFEARDQRSDMVYHVVVTFKSSDDQKQLVFRNAFCLFNQLQDIPPRLMLLSSTRQSDYCNLMGEIAIGRGKSAYDIAVEEGFVGSKEDWLKTLGQTPYESYKVWCGILGFEPVTEQRFWERFITFINI